ncbi:DUF2946 family protein [uncultured Roseobacter sp.]|uniref:DUF2946 family protein n=1 Tax=uncultured Roseobacter sp. TaxID=114847 RepID=UPI002619B8F6|nr:DUF2946 family protein [uncultured Roseobacter sp.]
MNAVLKSWLACVLCLVLIATGQSMAVARGAAAATGQMVICTGSVTKTVYTDTQGNPTSAPHICPECTAAAIAPTATRDTVCSPVRAETLLVLPGYSVPGARLALARDNRTRAPPF